MAQEKKGLKIENKQPLFGTGDLPSLDGLDVATFDSSYHDWPTSNSQFGLNPFEEQPLYRGFVPEEGHNLNAPAVRGFHPDDSYSSGTDFIDNGGFPVIGNDNTSFPVFKAAQPSKANAVSTKSLSSAIAEPRVEPPSPPGGYMEASYHMMSSGNPLALMQACLTCLAQSQIDCVPKHDQFKIKCQSFRSCARVSFTVFIWLVSAEANQKRYAVEFQRRSGCCMQFADVYRSAKRYLSEQRLIDKVKPSSVKEAPSAPPLEIQITVDQVRDTVKSLMNMATNKCVEMKAQGMLALAELTSSDSNVQKMMVEEGVADAMIDELNSEVVDVHRGALSGIANMSLERESMCTAMLDKGAVKTVQQLARSQHMQVVREAARLLSILGSTLGTKVVDNQFKSTLQFLRGSKDSKAREHVSSLLELLNM